MRITVREFAGTLTNSREVSKSPTYFATMSLSYSSATFL